jgi:TATA-box binding protein (TBP) (component of TFIID and TFIIIB)
MIITHKIHKFLITSMFSLDHFVNEDVTAITLKKSPFVLVEWRQFDGVCLVYKSGSVICHGFNVGEYYSHLLKIGYDLSPITLVTQSAYHKLTDKVRYSTLVHELNCIYEPEIFHGATKYIDKLHFIIYHTGTLIITGLRCEADIDKAYDFILQLELYNGI